MLKFINHDFPAAQTAEILAELGAFNTPDDIELTVLLDEKIKGLDIERKDNLICIKYSIPVYFYRALGLICEQKDKSYHIAESARFDTNGVMIDCSRNAVPNIKTLKKFIRRMALMGMNTLMLYTEDTYEIPGEPYFGYMRGRYTQDELRELDEYALGFGIELVPCIQTLAHLSEALKWSAYGHVKDTGDILLADKEDTYALIERMISSCRNTFKTRKIHVGMDEAHMLGRGKYYDEHGDINRFELMGRHLDKVAGLCKKYNFEPMIWSDMYFRLANGGKYYGTNPVPAEAAAGIPADVSLVYWDYYNDKATYDRMLKEHLKLARRTVFAGGAWKWQGYLPTIRTSIRRTQDALEACEKNGVADVFITAWGDNGAECGLFSLLPVFQAQAELCFYGDISDERLKKRLKTCAGASLENFGILDMPDLPAEQNNGYFAPHKYILFQDVLLGLFDMHVPDGMSARYARLCEKARDLSQKGDPYSYLIETASALYGVLALKAEFGIQLKKAYDGNDRAFLKKAVNEIFPELIVRTETFHGCIKRQWMRENKPFGFEVQDIRIGGIIQRLKTAKTRIEDYLDGKINNIPELQETRLPFFGENSLPDNRIVSFNSWRRMVSASPL